MPELLGVGIPELRTKESKEINRPPIIYTVSTVELVKLVLEGEIQWDREKFCYLRIKDIDHDRRKGDIYKPNSSITIPAKKKRRPQLA